MRPSPLNNLCFQDIMEGYSPILDLDQTQKNYVFVLTLAGWEWWCYCCYTDHSEMWNHHPQAEVVGGPMEEDKLMLSLYMFQMFLKNARKIGSLLWVVWSHDLGLTFQYIVSCKFFLGFHFCVVDVSIFCDVMPHHLVIGARNFKQHHALILKAQKVHEECQNSENMVTTYIHTRR